MNPLPRAACGHGFREIPFPIPPGISELSEFLILQINLRRFMNRRSGSTTMTTYGSMAVMKEETDHSARRFGNTIPILISVSYTHLRAHETPEHLVCRLLLEKK